MDFSSLLVVDFTQEEGAMKGVLAYVVFPWVSGDVASPALLPGDVCRLSGV